MKLLVHATTVLFAALVVGQAQSRTKSALDIRIERELSALSEEDRISQLVIVGFSGDTVNDDVRRMVRGHHVGGVALYALNIGNDAALLQLNRGIRELAADSVPPFIAVDQEGGEVTRIRTGVPLLPGAMALGAADSPALAYRAGLALGSDLRRFGFNMNLGPVVDIDTSAGTSQIGIRSLGGDPKSVSALAVCFARGQSQAGLVSVAKHFPGMGESSVDSHRALPFLNATREHLHATELVPFVALFEQGIDAVMVGHVLIPAIDPALPATISHEVITGLLRKELHFEGLVITDALQMEALRGRRAGIGSAAVDAVLAGADMVLVLQNGSDREQVMTALGEAVTRGVLTRDRIDESLRRILRVKLARGIIGQSHPVPAADRAVAAEVALRSITLLRNRGHRVPISSEERVAYIGPDGPINAALHPSTSVVLPVKLEKDAPGVMAGATALPASTTLIVGVAQNLGQLSALRAARAAHPKLPFILISLGSPDLIAGVPDVEAYLCAYGYLRTSQEAVALVLTGKATAGGRLPVAMDPIFPLGAGSGEITHEIQKCGSR